MNFLLSRSAPLLSRNVLIVMPLLGAFIGLAGPFASYSTMAVAARMGHFAICALAVGAMTMTASYYTARRFFHGCWPLWAALCVDAALAGPGALIVYMSLTALAPDSAAHVVWIDLLWQNFLMMLAFRFGSLFISWRRVRNGAALPSNNGNPTTPDLLRRKLPYVLRNEPILALSAEDHYLRVHTPSGEALILLTIAAASEMLAGGYQIHRSHWVARTGIKSVSGGAVHMVTGLRLPISRNRAKAFLSWLDHYPMAESGRL